MRRHGGIGRIAVVLLLLPWAAQATLPGATTPNVAVQPVAKPEPDAPVFGKGAVFQTPYAELGENVELHLFAVLAQRIAEVAITQLKELHPPHRVEVSIRFTLSPTLPPAVELTFAPGAMPAENAGSLRAALLKLLTVHMRKNDVSFTVTFVVRGADELRPARHAPPQGLPVPDAESESAAAAALAELAEGRKDPVHVAAALILGPNLFEALGRTSPEVKTLGISVAFNQPTATGFRRLVGRAYTGKANAIEQFLGLAPTRALGQRFRQGRARAATTSERGALYALVPYEIAGKPLPVVEEGKDVLLMETEKGKVMMMELVPGGHE